MSQNITPLICLLYFFLACSADSDTLSNDPNQDSQEEETTLSGRWNVELVEVTGNLMGVSASDSDPDSGGAIHIFSNGLGVADATPTLFSLEYPVVGDFEWIRDEDKVTVTESTGAVKIWDIIDLKAKKLIVSWTDEFSGGNAVFTWTLSK